MFDEAMESVRCHARVVVHFHPDRIGLKPMTVAEALLQDPSTVSARATALLSLARGAESMGDLGRAEKAAIEAQEIAANQEEAGIEFAATGLLESIGNGSAVKAVTSTEAAPPRVRRMVREFEESGVAVGWP